MAGLMELPPEVLGAGREDPDRFALLTETWLPYVLTRNEQVRWVDCLPPACPPDSQVSHGDGITLNLCSVSQKMKAQNRKGENTA